MASGNKTAAVILKTIFAFIELLSFYASNPPHDPICGRLSDDLTWKLGAEGWFTGGTVVGLVSIVMYLDAAAAKKQ